MPRPPDVGVGTAIILTRERLSGPYQRPRRQVLLGKRRGAHGAGLWAFTGGWLDRDDSLIEQSAAREVLEETGIVVDPAELRQFYVTTEPHPEFRTVTIFYVIACPPEYDVEAAPQPLEPNKCEEWRWFFIDEPPADLFGSCAVALRKLAREPGCMPNTFSRDAQSAMCACGGYAERVLCTKAEVMKHDCPRGQMFVSTPCCARAFVCRVCGARIVGKAEAPEME